MGSGRRRATRSRVLLLIVAGIGCACAAIACPVTAGNPPPVDPNAPAVEYWGAWGTVDGKFESPRTCAVSEAHVFVIDKTGRVQRFDAETGAHQLSWFLPFDNARPAAPEDNREILNPDGTPANLQNRYVRGFPVGCVWDETATPATLLVAHTHYQEVLRFSADGELLSRHGQYGHGDGEFVFPVRIALREDGGYYVSEYGLGADRIQRFASDGSFVSEFGGSGDAAGQFQRPQGLAIAPASNAQGGETGGDADAGQVPMHLYVADAINHRVQEFTLEGEPVATFGQFGTQVGQLCIAYGLTYEPERDLLVVAEFETARLSVFTRQGEFIRSWGGLGRGTGQFGRVWDVVYDRWRDRLLAPDYMNHRLAVIPAELVLGSKP